MACNEKLKADGKLYQRTCSDCGLGPCNQQSDYRTRYAAATGQTEREVIVEELRQDVAELHRLLQ